MAHVRAIGAGQAGRVRQGGGGRWGRKGKRASGARCVQP